MESSAAVKRQRSDCLGNVPQSDNVSGNAALRRPPSRERNDCRARYQLRVTERRATETAIEREARLARRRVQDRRFGLTRTDGTPVFNNCGAVNSTGLLLSPQKRPVFNTCGSVNSRGLLRSRQKRERPVFSKCGQWRIQGGARVLEHPPQPSLQALR